MSEGFISQGDYVPVAHVEMNRYASETLKTRACYYYLDENNMLDIYHDYLTGQINRDQLYASVPDGLLDTIIALQMDELVDENLMCSLTGSYITSLKQRSASCVSKQGIGVFSAGH